METEVKQNETIRQLTKKERKEERRTDKLRARNENTSKKHNNNLGSWGLWILLTMVIVGAFAWYVIKSPSLPESDFVSRAPFHWHTELTIYIKGEKQIIPAEIGLGTLHQPIHTHIGDNEQGLIHLEFNGVARKEDVMLGRFFKNWGKDIRSFGSNMSMTVNDVANTEYENYVMKDGDRIELKYE